MMDRREFLASAGAAAILPVAPSIGVPVTVGVDLSSKPSVTMWAVGTWGEYDWQPVAAESEDDAIRTVASWDGMICPETGKLEKAYDATRCEAWDNLKHHPTPADWLRAGMGHICDRCGYETASDDGEPIGDIAVCHSCMTVDDWEAIDPEYAAELRAEEDAD